MQELDGDMYLDYRLDKTKGQLVIYNGDCNQFRTVALLLSYTTHYSAYAQLQAVATT